MLSIELIATPVLPTSPSEYGSSEFLPVCVGKSNARDNPVWPWSSRNLNLLLVSSALPNPLYCRIVQNLSLYMEGYSPLVYGYFPGFSVLDLNFFRSFPLNSFFIGIPESVFFSSSTISCSQLPLRTLTMYPKILQQHYKGQSLFLISS